MRRARAPRPAPRGPRPDATTRPGGDDAVLLGEFGRAHGLAGEVRLKSYTGDPLAIGRYGALQGSDGRTYVLHALRPAAGDASDLLVARVAGITTREGAEALNRVALHVPRERLGEPEADEFFLADLIGLQAVDGTGGPFGTVVDVPNYGGGELLEIAPLAGGASALLPFTRAFVPRVDLAGGRLVIDPPADLFARPEPRPHAE